MNLLHTDPAVPLDASDVFSVQGHVILITGGGTGLGRYMTEGFVANGARVYIAGRRLEVLEQAAMEIDEEYRGKGKVYTIQGDISTKTGAKAIADRMAALEDHVDVLVNNAATQRAWKTPISDPQLHHDRKYQASKTAIAYRSEPDDPADTIEKYIWDGADDDDFNITNTVNINGPYFMTAALVPLLRKSDIRSVIVISSIAATANQRSGYGVILTHNIPAPHMATSTITYGVSKAATSHLATLLAGRLSPLGIRVNTISPGTFPSEITTTRDPLNQNRLVLKAPAAKAQMRTPAGRAGYRHEIVGPAILLASRAGGFMNNAMLAVDGGRNMVAGINDGVPLPAEAL